METCTVYPSMCCGLYPFRICTVFCSTLSAGGENFADSCCVKEALINFSCLPLPHNKLYSSLTHPLIHSFTHHSLIHSLTHPLTHSLIHSLIHSLTHPLTHSLTPLTSLLFTNPLTHLSTHSLTHYSLSPTSAATGNDISWLCRWCLSK